jgi:hypothetical protein
MINSFNPKKLAAAIPVALAASVASAPSPAVNLSDTGLGDFAYIPYYTVRNGYNTNVSVVNTSPDRVAVFKLHFHEGENSRDARDFYIFLSPNDVWTGTVGLGDDGKTPFIQTADMSCTSPWIGTNPDISFVPTGATSPTGGTVRRMNFTNIAYAGGSILPPDAGQPGIERTQEGYIEIAEAGTGDPETMPLAAMAVHGPTQDCASLNKILAGLQLTTLPDVLPCNNQNTYQPGATNATGSPAFNAEYCEPLNVLKVAANLITVAKGASGGMPVTQAANYINSVPGIDDPNGNASFVFLPALERPDPRDTLPPVSEQISDDQGYLAVNFSVGNPGFSGPIDAISSLVSATEVINEYAIGGAGGALSSWVVTFPTKNFYVDPAEVLGGPIVPFENPFTGNSCVTVNFGYFDREEASPETPPGDIFPSPLPIVVTPSNSICQETQTLQFGDSPLLGAANNYAVPLGDFQNGWMRLGFPNAGTISGAQVVAVDPALTPTGNTVTFTGLPVIGFGVKSLENGVVKNGVLLNYGIIDPHAYHRSIGVTQ